MQGLTPRAGNPALRGPHPGSAWADSASLGAAVGRHAHAWAASNASGSYSHPHALSTIDTLGATLTAAAHHRGASLGAATGRYTTSKARTGLSSVASMAEDVENALDELFQSGLPFLGKYIVLGPVERRAGGQGVVQFMRNSTGANFAVKVCARNTHGMHCSRSFQTAPFPLRMPAQIVQCMTWCNV